MADIVQKNPLFNPKGSSSDASGLKPKSASKRPKPKKTRSSKSASSKNSTEEQVSDSPSPNHGTENEESAAAANTASANDDSLPASYFTEKPPMSVGEVRRLLPKHYGYSRRR
jgi:hypothetical protein